MSERTSSSARGGETRERILDAAERLMAERGVGGVSLNEINGAAGQRNTAALHYHFGGRDGLVRAILRRHGAWLRERHAELFADLFADQEASGRPDVRRLVEVIVLPVAEYVGMGSGQRSAIRVWTSLLTQSQPAVEEIRALVDPALTLAGRALVDLMAADMPRELAVERLMVASQSVMHAMADRALLEEDPDGGRPRLPLPLVTRNLVDMMVAALTAPVDAATRAELAVLGDTASRR
ncbi:putative transcriptional regulator, TetR family protein [Actinomadura cremea]|nr:putative transcriptional regulator, TetR family protein [Actinomadura cremea]